MGLPRYRGPVETVEQAMWADRVLTITCQRCSGSRSLYAWKLFHARPRAGALPLFTAVGGFYCRGCRRKVQVVMVPDGPW